MTRITATLILSKDDGTGGAIHNMDVIEFGGKLWLVPEWLDFLEEKVTMPARIVSLETMRHQRMASQQIVVSDPVPKSVFEGQAPPQVAARYVVIEQPNIRLPLPVATH